MRQPTSRNNPPLIPHEDLAIGALGPPRAALNLPRRQAPACGTLFSPEWLTRAAGKSGSCTKLAAPSSAFAGVFLCACACIYKYLGWSLVVGCGFSAIAHLVVFLRLFIRMRVAGIVAVLVSTALASFHDTQRRKVSSDGAQSPYLNEKTKGMCGLPRYTGPWLIETGFVVDGNTIPEVDFDVGESYAGNLPNTPSGSSSLFFWFFPSSNPDATEEVRVAHTRLFWTFLS